MSFKTYDLMVNVFPAHRVLWRQMNCDQVSANEHPEDDLRRCEGHSRDCTFAEPVSNWIVSVISTLVRVVLTFVVRSITSPAAKGLAVKSVSCPLTSSPGK